MSEQKGLTVEQAKEQLSKLEESYNKMAKELNEAEKRVTELQGVCFNKLKELTVTQNQFYKGVIDIQNKQIADLTKKASLSKKEVMPVKKSQRRDNLS